MTDDHESLLLAPDFKLVVRWTARIMDFADEWQRHQALVQPTRSPAFWASFIRDALSGGERHIALEPLATIYRSSQLLPVPGELLTLGALKVNVFRRDFILHPPGSGPQVEVRYYLNAESYRYSEGDLPPLTKN